MNWRLPAAKPPSLQWQRTAWRLVKGAQANLWSPQGAYALRYLRRRGLTAETIQRAHLGYLPGHHWEWRLFDGWRVPCGITIPWLADNSLWAVKARRAAGLPKYTQVAGGSTAGLYNADSLEDHVAVLFVEGEFDALLAEQEAKGLVGVATLGSAKSNGWPMSCLNGCGGLQKSL